MPTPKDTKGPIVKTGPIAGRNRYHNQDGTFRLINGLCEE